MPAAGEADDRRPGPPPVQASVPAESGGGVRAGSAPQASTGAAAAGEPELWGRIVRSPGASPIVRAILTNSALVELGAAEAVISCPERYVRGAGERIGEIAQVFERELGRRVEVRVAQAAEGAEVSAGAEPAAARADTASPAAEDPLVKLAAELFGARIVAVQARQAPTVGP
ncbi:MAG: hypothetical protein ACK4WH_11885 [Phycisphaerales bacterium]